jgi:ribosomal-protein-alanine N-acetyltransferase
MLSRGKVAFRAWEPSDIPLLFKWLNDPKVWYYLDNPFPCKSLEQAEAYFRERKGQPYRYMILDALADGDTPIGTCHLFNLDWVSRCCEIAILICEETYWAKGYSLDTVQLLKDIAFRGLGMNRLEMFCVESNVGAHKGGIRAGFKPEGVLRQKKFISGKYEDFVVLGLLASEYFQDISTDR